MEFRRFLAAVAMVALVAGSVAFAVLPVTPSCGTVAANPDLTQVDDACRDPLTARRSTSLQLATVAGGSVLGAAAVNPQRVRRPEDPPPPDY